MTPSSTHFVEHAVGRNDELPQRRIGQLRHDAPEVRIGCQKSGLRLERMNNTRRDLRASHLDEVGFNLDDAIKGPR